jgi:Microsomal signal peptidase 12 kDa subunit (SPC12)
LLFLALLISTCVSHLELRVAKARRGLQNRLDSALGFEVATGVMDFEGQRLFEHLSMAVLLLFGAIAFGLGYWKQDFSVMARIYGLGELHLLTLARGDVMMQWLA